MNRKVRAIQLTKEEAKSFEKWKSKRKITSNDFYDMYLWATAMHENRVLKALEFCVKLQERYG